MLVHSCTAFTQPQIQPRLDRTYSSKMEVIKDFVNLELSVDEIIQLMHIVDEDVLDVGHAQSHTHQHGFQHETDISRREQQRRESMFSLQSMQSQYEQQSYYSQYENYDSYSQQPLQSWYMGGGDYGNQQYNGANNSDMSNALDTLQIRNIPRKYVGSDLVSSLNKAGFAGAYRFVYVPIDVDNGLSRGYAFVVAVDPKRATQMMEDINSRRVLGFKSGDHYPFAEFARRQGLIKNIEYFQNTALNARHNDKHLTPVYPLALPLLFDVDLDGMVIPLQFPEPIRQVPPRLDK